VSADFPTTEGGRNVSTLGFTGRIAAVAARRPWITLGVWALALTGALLLAGGLGDAVTDTQELTVATDSQQAQDLIEERLTGTQPAQEFVIVESATLTSDDPAFTAALARLTAELRSVDTVAAVASPLAGLPGLVSDDGHTALVVVTLAGDPDDAMETAEPVVAVVEAANGDPALRVTTMGYGSIGGEFTTLAEETLQRGELLGIPIALVILVLVFGAVVAAGIPLAMAGVAVVTALGLSAVVARVFDLSYFVTNMITMIGLAVGIDYTLFIVQRFREERRHGASVSDAVALAADSATRAVFFSGLTVVIALTGLLVMPDTTMRSLGTGAILVVLAAVAAALTLLPAMLRLLGDRVDGGRIGFLARRRGDGGSRMWRTITRVVTARPILSVLAAGGVLLLAAAPYLTIETGQNFIESLPDDSDGRHAFTVVNEEFDIGAITTPIVVDAPDVSDPAIRRAAAALTSVLEADPVYGAVEVHTAPTGDLLVLDVVTKLDPSSAAARTALDTLRTDTVPAVFSGVDARVLVGGEAASAVDYNAVLSARTPWILGFVLGVSFLLLMIVFRSIVVPLKAIVMNLLSVGAAYGMLVLVFQQGVGADLFGFERSPVIEAWIPMFLFTVLFGLSMDYHIFLLSRIRERYDAGAGNLESVSFGLSSTGAIITGAALIMVAVFGGFAAGDLVMFQQMGFGLAVAVILDATIVRSVLVPATMALLGDRNWYLPRWLRWLPQVRIDTALRQAEPAPLPERAAA
jgi:RND superfamily putative drug exporter